MKNTIKIEMIKNFMQKNGISKTKKSNSKNELDIFGAP